MTACINREDWLARCTEKLQPVFKQAGYSIPDNVKYTCGFPSRSALSRKRRRIGECWDARASAGETFEIFISPVLSDPLEVAATLAHELVHATVGLQAKHGAAFGKCARGIGLEGKMTATTAGDVFKHWFASVAEDLGDYPHKELRASSGGKPQTTRLLKVSCPECEAQGEPYLVRMSAKAYERGAPICPSHNCAMVLV